MVLYAYLVPTERIQQVSHVMLDLVEDVMALKGQAITVRGTITANGVTEIGTVFK